MRMLRLLLVGALLVFAGVAPAQAQARPQGPTVVTKGHDGVLLYFVWDAMDPPTQVAIFASDPQFFMSYFCEGQWPTDDDEWIYMDYTQLAIAAMKFNMTWKTASFTRVYQLTRPPAGDFDAYACSILEGGEGPLLAEGLTEWLATDRNVCGLGPGRHTWSFMAKGILAAPNYCPNGMARFEMQLRSMLANGAIVTAECAIDPADIRDIKLDLPTLACMGKPAP